MTERVKIALIAAAASIIAAFLTSLATAVPLLTKAIDEEKPQLIEDLSRAATTEALRKDEEFINKVAANIPPVAVYRVASKLDVPPGNGNAVALTCPLGMLPIGGGFKNSKSAVNLVQIYTEQRNLILSLDNGGGESLVVDAWAVCLKATEEAST